MFFWAPAVDQAEAVGVERTPQDVRGHVRHQGYVAGVGEIEVLGALDGVVRGDVDIGGVRIQVQFSLAGDPG
jgi:hypothetical protein